MVICELYFNSNEKVFKLQNVEFVCVQCSGRLISFLSQLRERSEPVAIQCSARLSSDASNLNFRIFMRIQFSMLWMRIYGERKDANCKNLSERFLNLLFV